MKQKITMKTSKNLTVGEAVELFFRKAAVKNLSKDTLNTYRGHLNAFCRYIDKDMRISALTDESVDGFILYLKETTKASDIIINTYLRTVRSFLYYSMDCGYLRRFKVVMPKVEKKIKPTYTDEELSRLLQKPRLNQCSFSEYRIWVFENYLLGTGSRLSSALNVRIGDIDFDNGTILLRKAKNRRQQLLPLSRTLAGILKEYLEKRGGAADDYLFCNIYGEKGKRSTFQQEVSRYNIQRNVNKTSCHLFRHTFAKKWVLSGGDIFRLQKILGHSDITVTLEYVNMFSPDLQRDFERFNPLDQIGMNTVRIKM